ncbi:thiol reductant ABC exporter subunit CydD [Vagococcus carniphilus]|uniref:Thiol reductant ABC exporter subunit CydD n=1 Tax=Vagococcus carniphilus TaxID=218144 RepID=A0A430B094_9ENTE|nr:thiol reductant ABC exporter subunit CydD [Vagococcus carniphilus]QNN73068.1 thiol reductant ABC exporter subunit CydD [Vagococcus carniphilus]RSU13716.1 thiol reductant ABC exporter subunit CydD [Vagococcus carniphilus]
MIDKNLFRIDKTRPVLIGLAGLGVLQALLIIGQAYFLSKAISALWNGSSVASQTTEMGIFFICFLLRQVLNFLRDRYLDSYAYEQSKVVRQQLLDKVFRLGPNFVQKEGTGNMVTMAIEGIAQIENYLTLILPKITNMMVIPWVILIFVFTQDIRSGIILLLVFPIIILFMIILGYAARAKADRQYEGYQLLSNHFLDSLRGLETLNFLGLSKKYEKNVYGISEDYRKATMSTLKIAILSTFALDFFTTLSVAIVAVFLGFKLMNGEMMLFPALTTLILAPDFFLPLRDFSSDYHATLDGGNTLKSIFNILDKKEFEEQENLSLDAWSEADSLTLTGLTLKYDEEATEKTLEDINFSWKGYGKIGVVGLSGSGKSTLIKLLGGFLEAEEPSIRVNSQLTNHLRLKSWQDQLLYVPQDPYIFHASLKDNIRFYQPQASERDILIAVERAGLLEVVKDLPEGLETIIGEGAHALSGGQLQRVAIARAFLDNNRQILLFDEPTAHLDVETEAELKSTMLPLFENHLVFFATHRLHWMKEMDYILVMKDGQIVEQGTYTELRQKKGAYHEFVEQLKGE